MKKTVHLEKVVCPWCGKKHGGCPDWVKSMPHRETCDRCGQQFLCWSEILISYHAVIVENEMRVKKPSTRATSAVLRAGKTSVQGKKKQIPKRKKRAKPSSK